MKNISLHKNDLPNLDNYTNGAVAIDTETMGLNLQRDRLCVVQLCNSQGKVDIVQITASAENTPNLRQLLQDSNITKIFHYARFDLAALAVHFGFIPQNIYCTKIASRLARSYSSRHGLRDLCSELLGIAISKQQQSSDWGAENLSSAQLDYAAGDVLYLHKIADILTNKLKRENRYELAKSCFEFLPTRVELDLKGWIEEDIFCHSMNNFR